MKKLMIVGVVVFALALTINVAFAETSCCGGPMPGTCGCPSQTNTAIGVNNNVSSSANTGYVISGKSLFGGVVVTGNASATTMGLNAVNSNVGVGSSTKQTNGAFGVNNSVSSSANSGYVMGGGFTKTGSATAGTIGINLVNTNISIGH